MKKIYDLCNMSSQQLFNLYQRIKDNKYNSIMVFDRIYYDDNHYYENNISLYNTAESVKFIIDNIKEIDFYGIVLGHNLVIRGRYIKVWY